MNTKIFLRPGHPSAASAPPASGGGASEAPSDSRQPAGKEPLPQWAGGLLQRLHHFLSGQLDRQQVHTHINTEAGHYYVAQEAFLLVPSGSQIQKAEFLQNFGLKEGFSFGKRRTVSKLGVIITSWSLCSSEFRTPATLPDKEQLYCRTNVSLLVAFIRDIYFTLIQFWIVSSS